MRILLLIFGTFVTGLAAGCGENPKLAINVRGAAAIDITSDEGGTIELQRVVINGRSGQDGCDIGHDSRVGNSESPITSGLPMKLQRGEAFRVFPRCGSSIMQVDVYTDGGHIAFSPLD